MPTQEARRPNPATLVYCLFHLVDPHIAQLRQTTTRLGLLRLYGSQVSSIAEGGAIDAHVENLAQASNFDGMRAWLHAWVTFAECSVDDLKYFAATFETCLNTVVHMRPGQDCLGPTGRRLLWDLLSDKIVHSKLHPVTLFEGPRTVARPEESSQQPEPGSEVPQSTACDAIGDGSDIGKESEGSERSYGSDEENSADDLQRQVEEMRRQVEEIRRQSALKDQRLHSPNLALQQRNEELERARREEEEEGERQLIALALGTLAPHYQAAFPRVYLDIQSGEDTRELPASFIAASIVSSMRSTAMERGQL